MARVLIVEDEADLRQIFADILYYNGFDVDQASDVLQAFDALKDQKPDAILMDVKLPGINGLQATEMIKRAPQTAAIPVIAMSAYDVDAAHAYAVGCCEILRKPIRPEVLVRTLRRATDEPGATKTGAAQPG